MYNFSDAWFLTTLILLSNSSEWISLSQILAGGDFINHAIFNTDEINRAITIFTRINYIELNDEKQIHITKKALEHCDNTFEKVGVFKKVEVLSKKLLIVNYDHLSEITTYFTDEEVNQAYKMYIERSPK